MARVAQLKAPAELRRRTGTRSSAKLELVEALLAENEARPCAALVLRWLSRNAGIERGLCAVADADSGELAGLAGIGIPPAAVDGFRLELDDRTHPLLVALGGTEPVAFHSSGHALLRPFETPLGADSFHAVPLLRANPNGELGPGLLLLTGPSDGPVDEGIRWAADTLGVRLTSLWYHRVQVDERRHKREREWLLGLINAVTDPILLTDPDGRILIANAGAEQLLTADEQKSEGRRRAVALHNMLFSASLFTAAEADAAAAEPTRKELLLVDPTEGQDLLFEVMTTAVPVRKGESGAVSILRNVTDLRRASEQIE